MYLYYLRKYWIWLLVVPLVAAALSEPFWKPEPLRYKLTFPLLGVLVLLLAVREWRAARRGSDRSGRRD
jgi:hypothetical protein